MRKLESHARQFGLAASIFILTSGGVWGAGWSEMNAGLFRGPAPVFSLTIDPAKPSTMYALTGLDAPGGLFKSTDGGGSWNAINSAGGWGGRNFARLEVR